MPDKKPINVAVIDTGVDPAQSGALAGAVTIERDASGTYQIAQSATDAVGHGTAVMALIADRLNGAALWSVGLADWPDVDSAGLARAIEWCIDAGIHVVNISAGSTGASARQSLSPICQQAVDAGMLLIAAEHNDGLVSYPAHLPSVIGVRGGRGIDGDSYHYRPGEPVECVARGDGQRLRWRGGSEVFVEGSSFAAPRVTVAVARIRQQHPTAGLRQVRQLLQRGATRVAAKGVTAAPAAPEDLQMRAVAVYPFTKEAHALIRFPELLSFDVTGVADPPGRGLAGQDAGSVIGAEATGVTVQARLVQAVAGADTLVLGYVRQLGQLRRRDLHAECLRLALDRGLNVFSFEPLTDERYGELLQTAKGRGLRFVSPGLSNKQADAMLADPLQHGPVDRPVLGIFGTSASQGKFTLQLALRRRLLQLGYRLAQIGTEHHSALFGMDFTFPMGHGSTVEADVARYPALLDRVMRRLCADRAPDLMLVGSQSGTVPFDCADQRTLSLASLAFLMGTRPDACVLVVNAVDPDWYVEATIAGLHSIAQTQTIALAVSDQGKRVQQRHGRAWTTKTRMHGAELAAVLGRLEQRFGLPAFCIADTEGIQRLADQVLGYFARTDSENEQWQKQSA